MCLTSAARYRGVGVPSRQAFSEPFLAAPTLGPCWSLRRWHRDGLQTSQTVRVVQFHPPVDRVTSGGPSGGFAHDPSRIPPVMVGRVDRRIVEPTASPGWPVSVRL